MAARPGEELVATLFADLHYYYGSPTAKPPHHRFDKGSYVYLFENASQRRARIEVANNAGTPEQDAFNGHLDGAHIQYSYKHSTLITLTVDGPSQAYAHAPADSQEWHLPTFDPKNDRKYMYKLHTVDIYFWTKEDALQFLNGVRRVLSQQQVVVLDEPVAPPPHQNEMSPVVQQLENVAITDPSYQQGRTRDSRTAPAPSFPGPPGPPISATPQSQEASNFAPMAYNPAAPAAPEVIQYRVKTPPPEDGAENPLVAAATSDQGQSYGVPFQNPGGFSGPPQAAPQQSYFPGPPPASAPPPSAGLQSPYSQPPPSASLQSQFGQPLPSAGLQSQFSQPPPSAGLQSPYAHSFAPPPAAPKPTPPYSHSPASSIPSPPASLPPPPAPPAYQAHPASPPVTQYANYPGSPGLPPGMSTPGLYSPGQPYTPGAPPPPGGFAQYNYNPSLSHTVPLGGDYSIHQQVYRPTEGEVTAKTKPSKPPRGKLEERAGQLEKGVGGFLKKLEKKIG